ncbi:MAG: methyltransferase domain-containing protein [Chitinivibrionales bacterium]|nr:methyltransferase domain-containing protein [Chitinivibrionales bacterium]MBD3355588.1 methyltransferase domain-containing protein [Chitinivibrionales bacterium]
MSNVTRRRVGCRICGDTGLKTFLDLGSTPPADRLVSESVPAESEPRFPLEVAFCRMCRLVQILETVPPEVLFCEEYPYYSSFSPQLLDHSRANALELIEERGLDDKSLVVELASNDGYLLRNYVEKNIPVLGIDPAEGPVRKAEEGGVRTLKAFFTLELASRLSSEGYAADVIHANNVLAHVADTNGFVEGIRVLLKDAGVAVIEVPYVRELIDKCEFDTIYHEHLCYFSVTTLNHLFRKHTLYLNKILRLPIHGGSLRLYVNRRENVDGSVRAILEEEDRDGVTAAGYYDDFAGRVHRLKKHLLNLLSDLKGQGKRIAAYGAAAKGGTLLNYTGIGREYLDYVVDRNVHKHGKYMPGIHLPVSPPERLLTDRPDYVLILAWNFADEIIGQLSDYASLGGRFIIPIPEPRVR